MGIQTAEQMEEQMNAVSDLFSLIQTNCIAKCDNGGKDLAGHLTVGEALCLDRVSITLFNVAPS